MSSLANDDPVSAFIVFPYVSIVLYLLSMFCSFVTLDSSDIESIMPCGLEIYIDRFLSH